ncbi:MAG: MraY family glycosyltransferase [Propionibacteriaceae bacterium]
MIVSIALVGFMEDLRGLRVSARMASQLLIFGFTSGLLTLTENLPPHLALLAWLGGAFYVNAANFMDGANGISSLHGTLVGGYYALVGTLEDGSGLTAAGIVVSVAFLSFLPWNVGRSRVFMGDVGSYALGAGAWSLAVWALSYGVALITAVAPLIVYTIDVLHTLIKRMAKRAPLHEAHREHTYQRLMPHFQSHAIPTGMTTGATAGCAGLGIWALIAPESTPWTLGGMVIVAFAYLLSPTLPPLTNLPSRKGLMDESV